MTVLKDGVAGLIASQSVEGLGAKLARTIRDYNEVADAFLHNRNLRVRPSHLSLLALVEPYGIRTTELAARLEVTKQAASQMVASLVASGHLERAEDPHDARAHLVFRTDLGDAVVTRGLDILIAIDQEIARRSGLPVLKCLEEDLDAIRDAIRHLLDAERASS